MISTTLDNLTDTTDTRSKRDSRLAARPLVQAVAARGGLQNLLGEKLLGGTLDVKKSVALERAFNRARVNGVLTLWAADELSVGLLDLHPASVWGIEWFSVQKEFTTVEE